MAMRGDASKKPLRRQEQAALLRNWREWVAMAQAVAVGLALRGGVHAKEGHSRVRAIPESASKAAACLAGMKP
jgi:hypothetical protein